MFPFSYSVLTVTMDSMLHFCTGEDLANDIEMLSVPRIECSPFENMQEDCFLQVYAYFNCQQAVCALDFTSKAMLSKVQTMLTEPGIQCCIHFHGSSIREGNGGQSTQGA